MSTFVADASSIEAPLDPNEEPLPLEGDGSDEQSEWESDGPILSLLDKRTIIHQRAIWLADSYFGYGYEVDRYTLNGSPVKVTFAGTRSASPLNMTLAYLGDAPSVDARPVFEAHFARVIEDEEVAGDWEFIWGPEFVTARKVAAA